jgi:hypothetical protein
MDELRVDLNNIKRQKDRLVEKINAIPRLGAALAKLLGLQEHQEDNSIDEILDKYNFD